MLPTPKAKAGSGMQIIPTTGVVVNAAPKSFDQISPSISLTALNPKASLTPKTSLTPLNPKATNTSQRNSSPSTNHRSGLQIKQVKGADGRTQLIATPSPGTPTSQQKTFPVTLKRTSGSNSPQIVGSVGKGAGVPPLAKVSNVATISKPGTPTSKPSMISVNLNKLNDASTRNTNPQHTAAAKAMLSLSNSRQVIMKQGKQIVVKKINGNGPTAVSAPQSHMQIVKKATLSAGKFAFIVGNHVLWQHCHLLA